MLIINAISTGGSFVRDPSILIKVCQLLEIPELVPNHDGWCRVYEEYREKILLLVPIEVRFSTTEHGTIDHESK